MPPHPLGRNLKLGRVGLKNAPNYVRVSDVNHRWFGFTDAEYIAVLLPVVFPRNPAGAESAWGLYAKREHRGL